MQKSDNMEEITFDVMLDGRYVRTLRYKFCKAFTLTEQELKAYAVSKIPRLKNKQFNIVL